MNIEEFKKEMRMRKIRPYRRMVVQNIIRGAGVVTMAVLMWVLVVGYMLVFTD